LRGTQFWRVSDWLEDVRMWTEPVVFSILSVVFPTIRAWSPHTTAMVQTFFLVLTLGLVVLSRACALRVPLLGAHSHVSLTPMFSPL